MPSYIPLPVLDQKCHQSYSDKVTFLAAVDLPEPKCIFNRQMKYWIWQSPANYAVYDVSLITEKESECPYVAVLAIKSMYSIN